MTEIATSDRKILSPQARTFVRELLHWAATVARAESRAKGHQSSTAVVCDVLALGVVGTGCSGTKGTGRAPREEGEPVKIDAHGAARYARLTRDAKRVANAIIDDGRGDVCSAEQFKQRRYEVSFLVRVGMTLANEPQREKWRQKFALGDPKPAIMGAEQLALPLVEIAAGEWCAHSRDYDSPSIVTLSKEGDFSYTDGAFIPITPVPIPADERFTQYMPVWLPGSVFEHILPGIER